MLTYILLAIAALVVLVVILAATKPNTARYERSIVIASSPDRILPHIADFHKWIPWSPWEKLDPTMSREYSGAASGRGAKYSWTGTGKAGEGSMEVLEATDRGVHIDLQFVRPFKNTCETWFKFEPEGGGTRVVWTMTGPNLFIGKVMGLFINMDKMIGKDFENGLAELKATVEKGTI
ncbi:MAG: SRPBCC family protein [Flavobacteriales bacterium]